MAVSSIDINTFLQWRSACPVIDVRSPAEFKHAHIPGAVSLPLFSDEERKVVGTTYKQESRHKAIKVGLKYFGPNMVRMIEEVETLIQERGAQRGDQKTGLPIPINAVLVHCWRGGMRSAGVAWLLDLYGYKVYTLKGGYKSFRQWAHRQFETQYPFAIIGGYTGSGKTFILEHVKKSGKSALDLEALANHKGSAFGSINMPPQPSQEMFENLLALELDTASQKLTGQQNLAAVMPANHKNDHSFYESDFLKSGQIWLEDESQRIGNVNIPVKMWQQMRAAQVYFINLPFEQRLNYLVADYGKGDKAMLVNAIMRIKKRLGGLETKTALNFLLEENLKECFRVLLAYYDKHYLKGLHSRPAWQQQVTFIDNDQVDPAQNARLILSYTQAVTSN